MTAATQEQRRAREHRRVLFESVAGGMTPPARAIRRNVADAKARFQVCSFEDFAGGGPFDLIVSATAFYWVDPGVGLAKAARLLRPGGWLAPLTTGERYPEPLQSRLHDRWMRYCRQGGKWPGQPTWLTALRETSLFGSTVEASHHQGPPASSGDRRGVERIRQVVHELLALMHRRDLAQFGQAGVVDPLP